MAKVATKSIDGLVLTIRFENGAELRCDSNQLSEETKTRLMMHGLSQKVGDSYASSESLGEAVANAEGQWENLRNGEWAARSGGGILAEALARVTGKDLAECIAAVRKLDDKNKKALMKDARILTAIAQIHAERAKDAGSDLSILF